MSSADISFRIFDLPQSRIRLAVLPTRKLKTVLLKAYVVADLDDALAVTRRALLPMVLRRGTARRPDIQAIQRHLEGLYGASLASGIHKLGEWQVTRFRLEAVNQRFLPGREPVFEQALEFLRELIFEPALEGSKLRRAEVEQEKRNLKLAIESLIDQKDQYACERLVREMCRDEPYRLNEHGEIEALARIGPEDLTAAWRDSAARQPLTFYIAGDVEPQATFELLGRVFGAARPGGYAPRPPPKLRHPGAPRAVEESLAVAQGKLCLGYRSGASYLEGDLEALIHANAILGGFSHSKLFQNVREKASLAYDVHSFLEKSKGLLCVLAGIAVERRPEAQAIIEEQLAALQRGELSAFELDATRESLDNHLAMLEDNFSELMEIDFVWSLHGRRFDLTAYRERLRSVSPERIVEAARRVELDTVYFLRSPEPGA